MTNSINVNQGELLQNEIEILKGVYEYLKDQRGRERQLRHARIIMMMLLNEPEKSLSERIRKNHDLYGWMAKNEYRGRCAGAIYRTLEYMKIPAANRDGSQGDGRNIHIEHTVPVRVLDAALKNSSKTFHNVSEMHWFMMRNSICVAFSHQEEKWLSYAKVPQAKNDAFDASGERAHDYPFQRYIPLREYAEKKGQIFKIFNIVTKKEVCLKSYTFEDHENSLMAAPNGIYKLSL